MIQGYHILNGSNSFTGCLEQYAGHQSNEAIVACVKIACQKYFDTKTIAGI